MPAWTLDELARKDPFGDRIHFALAALVCFTLPVNGGWAGFILAPLVGWGALRTLCWRRYLPAGPAGILFPAAAWIGLLAISLTWAPDPRQEWHQLWSQRWALVIPLLWPLMDRWRWLLSFTLAGCLLQTTTQTFEGIMAWSDPQGQRISGFETHPRTVAVWSAGVVVGLIGLHLGGLLHRRIWLLGCVPPLLAIILSGSRGALLALLIAIPTMVVALGVRRRLTARGTVSMAAAIVVAGSSLAVFHDRIMPQFERAAESVASIAIDGEATDIRLLWWRSSLRQWNNHPLLGYGLGGTADALRSDPELTTDQRVSERNLSIAVWNQPHSVYLQILLEGGLIGVATFAFLLLAIARAAWRNSLHHPLGAIAIGGLVIWMTTAAFDAWHTRSQPLAFLWFTALLAAFDPSRLLRDSVKNPPEGEHPDETSGLSKSRPSPGR
ncbi:MAG: hypothetical protein CMJ27_04080 [Phycisphaerae bacterium]|nr:hypothetical protein [Phycisphaerae bacterium]OUX02545.1 MAG: hypothetical protein CBD91_02380 [Phycisphaeraceae bacterium TMED231]